MISHQNRALRLHPARAVEIIPRQRGGLVSPVSHERLLTDNLPAIRAISARIAWRGGLRSDEVEDFCSHVVEKLIDRDYAVLRRFEGRSSLPTYLAVVIQRMFQDYRNHLWGKWRPSMEARRQGTLAVRLERLLGRDGLTFEEAAGVLEGSGETVARGELEALAQRLPVRVRRRFDSDDVLSHVPDASEQVEEHAIANRLRPGAERLRNALDQAVATLPDEDAALIRLCFWEQMSVAAIARAFAIPQKPLYRRIERVLQQLRRALSTAGVDDEARLLLDHLWSDFLEAPDGDPAATPGNRAMRPSNPHEVTGARG